MGKTSRNLATVPVWGWVVLALAAGSCGSSSDQDGDCSVQPGTEVSALTCGTFLSAADLGEVFEATVSQWEEGSLPVCTFNVGNSTGGVQVFCGGAQAHQTMLDGAAASGIDMQPVTGIGKSAASGYHPNGSYEVAFLASDEQHAVLVWSDGDDTTESRVEQLAKRIDAHLAAR
jgi:hypothetical protein